MEPALLDVKAHLAGQSAKGWRKVDHPHPTPGVGERMEKQGNGRANKSPDQASPRLVGASPWLGSRGTKNGQCAPEASW